ncbi:hypothetical protein BDK51DRAFT_49269 [Blyttiomyces helicus]|uniref:Uncharacterized protein n=1 Tax=Blyttiomyces helicus TaxID=388810 RepID=A0A4P9VXG0_9FUNG|nr:hypothetical protein BDK51DRAFT_49269 [Blyttiomyces helicus]|eukprot:RKO82990.1 hypothetical protein BDK51DRAFT_49269 [Blyttiomyces helicus]
MQIPALQRAQTAIARRDYKTAATAFSEIITTLEAAKANDPSVNLAVPLLSRVGCFVALRDWEGVLVDSRRALEDEEDVTVEEELLPGCYSTRAAAAVGVGERLRLRDGERSRMGLQFCGWYSVSLTVPTRPLPRLIPSPIQTTQARMARAHEELKNPTEATRYKKMLTSLMKASSVKVSDAATRKEAGNALFKSGDFAGALREYEGALVLAPHDGTLMSNACQALIRLGRLDEAREMSDRCVLARPKWGKAWYRQGTVALKQNRILDAAKSFQEGLKVDPDDPDLKAAYMKAAKAAEKLPKKSGGFDKQLMGMMMELKNASWDVAGWWKESQGDISFWSRSECDEKVASFLAHREFLDITEKAVKVAHPTFERGMLPADFEPELKVQWPPKTAEITKFSKS